MRIVFSGVIPKELEYPDSNEDAYLIENNTIAISDGASESFDAKNWAQILVQRFISNVQFNEAWLSDAIKEYSCLYNREELSWSKQASFDRGCFATLLGIVYHEESKSIEVFSVGDSLAVLIDNGHLNKSYPYVSFEEFSQEPSLLSTNNIFNDFIRKQDFFLRHSVNWSLDLLSRPLILCMTDALGEWFLRTYQSDVTILETLLSFRTEADMQEYVSTLRENRAIRTDDTTLIIIDFSG